MQSDLTELRGLIARYGNNSNSFLTLYHGFTYFKGAIAYRDTGRAWIGACAPMADIPTARVLLREFATAATEGKRIAVILPVDQATVEASAELGYGAIQIGTEPTFLLTHYDPQIELIQSAKHLHQRGARVIEFVPRHLSHERRSQLDEITSDWLATRKTVMLDFLNRVEPWSFEEDKKYFLVEHNTRILAYIAAVPIWKKNGWYFIDILRRPDAHAGTVELLIIESMRILKNQGAQEISLGVAPLAGLEKIARGKSRFLSLLNSFFRAAFENGGWFYNFQSLYQFKIKFRPNHSEKAYLIHFPANRAGSALMGLMHAMLPGGFGQAVRFSVRKTVSRDILIDWLQGRLSDRLVTRSITRQSHELVRRCRFTLLLLALNFLIFIVTIDSHGHLQNSIAGDWAYSWNGLQQRGLQSVLLSPFLHNDTLHLLFNQASLLIFCGGTELLGGAPFMLLVYGIAALLSNPLTSLLFQLPIQWLAPSHWPIIALEIDVGASLGIFGCAGALSTFFKNGWMLLLTLSVGSLGVALISHSILSLNHFVSLVLGVLIARLFLR